MRKVISGIAICAMAFSVSAKDVDAEQVVQDSLFDGIYAGLGIGGSFLKTTGGIPENGFNLTEELEADRFIGSVVVGAGKVINKVYGGFEILLDISKNKKGQIADIGADGNWKNVKSDVDMRGYIPQINLKAGYSFSPDTVIYGKIGCAWSKVSSSYDGSKETTNKAKGTNSKTKTSIVLGVGAEKIFSNRFSTSLEVDYNFGGRDKYHVDAKAEVRNPQTGELVDAAESEHEETLHWSKGWSIRALAKYNVKI